MSSKPPELQPNPGINAGQITWYVTDRMRAGTIHLYPAYLLMHEALRFKRLSYTQPAWKQRLGISGLLGIYFDWLTGKALGCHAEADESAAWFVADIPLLQEKRKHFFTDRLHQGSGLLSDASFHRELSALREQNDSLSDDDGPWPTEVFPFHFAAPERELLEPGSQPQFSAGQEMDPETSDFYIQLQLAQ